MHSLVRLSCFQFPNFFDWIWRQKTKVVFKSQENKGNLMENHAKINK
jgi:hypothetical protein